VPAPINAVLSAVLAFERQIPGAIPFGLSVFVVGEKVRGSMAGAG